jgi:hypothetical protein
MSTVISNVFVSFACRVELSQEVLDLVKEPGIIDIPTDLLPARQMKLKGECEIPSRLKWHRDAFISTISRETANDLWLVDKGDYLMQSLLVFSMDDYLSDTDVIADDAEYKRAKSSGCHLVVVAVIGENRSPLSVCRNIVSGCQDMEKLKSEAEGAVGAASVVLIED